MIYIKESNIKRRIRGALVLISIVMVLLAVWGNQLKGLDKLLGVEGESVVGESILFTKNRKWPSSLTGTLNENGSSRKKEGGEATTENGNHNIESPEYLSKEEGPALSLINGGEGKDMASLNNELSRKEDPTKDDRQLIDFGVVGFEKSGTTFLLENIFAKSKQVFMAGAETGSEVHALHPDDLNQLKNMFRPHVNETTDDGAPIRRGFKNPMVYMNRPWLHNLQDNFPTTKFIVTVRHPVLWFQSWYNFKLRTGHLPYPMPTPHEAVGLCREACRHKGPEGSCIQVRSPGCSGHSDFHHYLSRMGYTPMDTEDELFLLDHHQMKIFNFSQTNVFLTEIGQMNGKNTTVSNEIIRSMERFLDLENHALPDIQPYVKPKYTWSEQKLEDSIDICDGKYEDIRIHLLDTGRKAGRWIEQFFLESPHVVVADRQDLVNRIRYWNVDPCE